VTSAAALGLLLVGVAAHAWPHGELRRTASAVYAGKAGTSS
jgi:hypothetical protein